MSTLRAIAGADIRVGMTVSLRPGDKPFKVTEVVVSSASERYVFLYSGDTLPAEGATYTRRWYAEVVES